MAIDLTLRRDKGSALTHNEADDNFENLSNAVTALEDRVAIAIAEDGSLNDPGVGYAAHTGGTDAYSITVPGTYASLDDLRGVVIQMRANFTNDGPCTLAVNGLAATNIKKDITFDPDVADIVSGYVSYFAYNGSTFQLINPRSKNGTNFGVSTGTADALKVEFADTSAVSTSRFQFPSTIYSGYRVSVQANSDNTGTATLEIKLASPVISLSGTIKKNGTQNLVAADIRSGTTYDFQWDGTYWQLMSRGTRVYRQDGIAVPLIGGEVGSIAHGLGKIPDVVRWTLVSNGTNTVAHGYSSGDVIELDSVFVSADLYDALHPFTTATNLDLGVQDVDSIEKKDHSGRVACTRAQLATDFTLSVFAAVLH